MTTMTRWHAYADVDLGLLPYFFIEGDKRSANEQIDERYAHGGGWSPFSGFLLHRTDPVDPFTWRLRYPGDPHLRALGWTKLRQETVVLFEGSWLAIVQNDGNYEVSRVD